MDPVDHVDPVPCSKLVVSRLRQTLVLPPASLPYICIQTPDPPQGGRYVIERLESSPGTNSQESSFWIVHPKVWPVRFEVAAQFELFIKIRCYIVRILGILPFVY